MFVLEEKRDGLERELYQISLQVVEEEAKLKLYDVEFIAGQKFLRVFIYQEGTMTATLDDCVKVDGLFTPHLEALSTLPESLRLEVSSPGVFRNIRTIDHLKMAVGEVIKIKVSRDIGEEGVEASFKGSLRGTLKELLEDRFILEESDSKKKRVYTIPLMALKKAHLDPNWEDLISSRESEESL